MRKNILIVGGICVLFLLLARTLYADESVAVTGSIPPKASDFQLAISSDTSTTVPEDTKVTYTITYGSHLYYADQLIVEASWDQGTLQGANVPSVTVASYVTGSGTTAYNTTKPVIDLVNQTIRWAIPAFPAQTTNQTVSFQLQTTPSYQGETPVTWPVKVHIITPSFTTADESVTNSYLFDPAVFTPTPLPTATPTPGSTTNTQITPMPTKASTLSPTPALPTFAFTGITFQTVSFDTISLLATTNTPAKLTARYGTSPQALSHITSDTTITTQHTITLPNLQPQTPYFVVLTATAANGQTVTSEIYNFTTGQKAEQPQIDPQTVSFSSSDIVLFSPKPNIDPTKPAPTPVIVVPQNTAYNFRFQVTKPDTVSRVQAIIRNKFVLGITSVDALEPNTLITDLIETQPGVFEGRLKTPVIPGAYEEFIRIYDTKGNIQEHSLADVHVSEPFRIVNAKNQKPIEAAQVYLYYFNALHHQYEPLPPQLFPVKNPGYTDYNGQLVLALPQGKYKATITAIGYKPQDISFLLDAEADHDYPMIKLTPEPFNLLTVGKYYFTIIQDVLGTTKLYIQSVSYSVRFFDLNAVIASALLVFLTLLAFSSRIHVPLRFLLTYFTHLSRTVAAQKTLGQHIKGRIFDKETGNSVANAHIYLLNAQKGDILAHTQSNKTGDFVFTTLPQKGYDLQIMADGFEPIIYHESDLHAVELQGYLLSLERRPTLPSLSERIGVFVEKFLSLGFEALLLLSFVFELSIGFALGFEKTLIFLIFSGINLFLWLVHMTHLHTQKEVF